MALISSGTQTVRRVLDQIGLTSLTPHHPQALRHSCHHKTASVIYQYIDSGQVRPTDEVVLVGIGKTVFHSFLIRNGKVLYDSDNGLYNHESQTYNAENWQNSHFKENIAVLARQSVADIRQNMARKMAQNESGPKTRPPSPR